MRGFVIVFAYAFALYFIWAGFALAPDMKWPHTDVEYLAAAMIAIGCGAKLLAHWMFLFPSNKQFIG